ncbi:uridine kinase family protein [Actinotalea caeni]|uniref:uridine kinase family protein n=1 Tax=Actinotalea caeni TaxID=1348467 RepID=UPI0014789A12|nr:4-amino-4-deoxy-L-arabinose transferase [Actinotalea caeni]
MTPAQAVLDLAARRGPRCGDVTVVLVDGPAGSGKTTLAAALEDAAGERGTGCTVVHMDDLYAGWQGLREGGAALTALLRDLAAGAPAGYRRYDWVADRYAETVPVPPVALLVVEGVGSARTEHLDCVSVLVWVEEPDAEERVRRGLARDGAAAEPHWRRWMVEEAELFAEVGTRARADVAVDGAGRLVATS